MIWYLHSWSKILRKKAAQTVHGGFLGGWEKNTKLDCDRNALDPGVTGEGHMYDLGVKTLRELSEN